MPAESLYPDVLEAAWLQQAMPVSGARDPQAAVDRLEGAAGSLSDAFTTGRDPDFAGYRSRPRALAAYGLFFFPRAYARTRLVLRECRAAGELPPGAGSLRVLDLGAGTGAAGLAALQELSGWCPDVPVELDMVDSAREGMALARPVVEAGRALWPRARVREVVADARTYRPDAPVDLILCSFALNEWVEQDPLFPVSEWVEGLLGQLRPGGWLVLLEPALHTAVERMEKLRDVLAASGRVRIMAPCPHHGPCPMLSGRRGWCHEVRTWNGPESLRRINRRLRRDVHLLKYSFLALAADPPPVQPASWMRLVSPVKKEKGKYVLHGCGGDGCLHRYEWMTRHLEPEEKEQSEALERGDRIAEAPFTLLGDGVTRRLDGPPSPSGS